MKIGLLQIFVGLIALAAPAYAEPGDPDLAASMCSVREGLRRAATSKLKKRFATSEGANAALGARMDTPSTADTRCVDAAIWKALLSNPVTDVAEDKLGAFARESFRQKIAKRDFAEISNYFASRNLSPESRKALFLPVQNSCHGFVDLVADLVARRSLTDKNIIVPYAIKLAQCPIAFTDTEAALLRATKGANSLQLARTALTRIAADRSTRDSPPNAVTTAVLLQVLRGQAPASYALIPVLLGDSRTEPMMPLLPGAFEAITDSIPFGADLPPRELDAAAIASLRSSNDPRAFALLCRIGDAATLSVLPELMSSTNKLGLGVACAIEAGQTHMLEGIVDDLLPAQPLDRPAFSDSAASLGVTRYIEYLAKRCLEVSSANKQLLRQRLAVAMAQNVSQYCQGPGSYTHVATGCFGFSAALTASLSCLATRADRAGTITEAQLVPLLQTDAASKSAFTKDVCSSDPALFIDIITLLGDVGRASLVPSLDDILSASCDAASQNAVRTAVVALCQRKISGAGDVARRWFVRSPHDPDVQRMAQECAVLD